MVDVGNVRLLFAELDRLRAENEKLRAGRLPDDDEPITDEWWEAEHINDKLHVIDNCPVSLVIRRGSVELILNIEEGFRLSILLRAVRTRGDVRQLVKLLGRE